MHVKVLTNSGLRIAYTGAMDCMYRATVERNEKVEVDACVYLHTCIRL